MPDAEQVTITEAVKVAIEAAELSQEFTVERSYADWDLELASNTDLRVDVVAVTTKQTAEPIARGPVIAYTVPVDVAVRKRFATESQDDEGRIPNSLLDPLVYLVQEIHELFALAYLTGNVGKWAEPPRILVCPNPRDLRQNKQFTAILRLTFRSERNLAS